MYSEEKFNEKVKEWLSEENLPFRGHWSIERDMQSTNSVCISVEISLDKLIINKDDNKEINIPLSSSSPAVIDDDEYLKKAVLELYHSVLVRLNESFKMESGVIGTMIESGFSMGNDILIITEQTKKELLQYCEEDLVNSVFEDFSRNGKIIVKKKEETPSRYWIITNYINANTKISKKCKLAVILSMSAIGGFIQIREEHVIGWEKVLHLMKKMSLVDDSEMGYFIEAFSKLTQGQRVIFTLNIDNY